MSGGILLDFLRAAVEFGITFMKRSDGGDVAETAAHDGNVNIALRLRKVSSQHFVRICADCLAVVEHHIIFCVLAVKPPFCVFRKIKTI